MKSIAAVLVPLMSILLNSASSAPQLAPTVVSPQQLPQQSLLARQQQQQAALLQLPQRQGVPDARGVFVAREEPSDNIGLDAYHFSYELSDGQTREETAQIERRSPVPEDAVLRVRGSYSWIDPATGQQFSVSYVADENGFQPRATHLPGAGRAVVAAVAPVGPLGVANAAVLRP